MSLTNIYILKLEGGKYYVGKTDNPTKRYQEHVEGNGSAWTKKYPPVAVEKIIPNASAFDEDKYTKEMMASKGIEHVRGGSYVRVTLESEQINVLTKELRSARDLCSGCGKTGHFVQRCPKKKVVVEEVDEYGCEYCDRTFKTVFGCRIHEKSCRDKSQVVYACGECDKEFSTEGACVEKRRRVLAIGVVVLVIIRQIVMHQLIRMVIIFMIK